MKQDRKLENLLSNAVEDSSDDSGWAALGTVGNRIAKQSPEFDPRNYGYGKLSTLVSATKLFKSEVREQGSTNHKFVYIRELKKK